MKITDVTLTLFAWDDIPATTYGRHTGRFSGKSELGLLTLQTDEGPAGHAFLGSAMRGANMDAASVAIDKVTIAKLEAEAVVLRDMIDTLKGHNEDWTRQAAALTQIINTQQKLIEAQTDKPSRWQFWRKE